MTEGTTTEPVLTSPEAEGEIDYQRELRGLLAPLLGTLALTALLVVGLAATVFWTARQTGPADAALAHPPAAHTSGRNAPALRQHEAGSVAHGILPRVMAPLSFALPAVILALLAFGGYRASTRAQNLTRLFAGRANAEQERIGALRRRQALLTATLAGTGDAVIVADPAGRITLLNPTAEGMTGWQEADALGREVRAVLTLVDERTGAALTDLAAEVLADSVRRDYPSGAVQVARGGVRHPVAGSLSPLTEEDGGPGVALFFRDKSECRNMAARRDSWEARAEALLTTTRECVVLMRQSGEIAGFNPAAERTFGWTRRKTVGQPAADLLFPPPSRDGFQRAVERSQASTDASPAWTETLALNADGRPFPAEMAVTPIPRQEAPLFAIHLRDLSERRDAEALARTESREKSALLGSVSDELRTPLNAILGYTEMLQEEASEGGNPELLPDLQKIHAAGEHLLSLVNDVRDLSRTEAGQMELYRETFDVAKMVAEVGQEAGPSLAKNGNVLQVRVAEGVGEMEADRVKIKQTLLNLLSDAAGFAQGETVALDAGRDWDGMGDWITFRLADANADQALPQIGTNTAS